MPEMHHSKTAQKHVVKNDLKCQNLSWWVIRFQPSFPSDFTGVASILYECRLGCLETNVPQKTQDYIGALNLMFSSFKTTMYAGAIPKWLRPIIPKPWEEFCNSWDGLFKFSKFDATFSSLKLSKVYRWAFLNLLM